MKVDIGGIIFHDTGYDERNIHSVARIDQGLTKGIFCSEILRCHCLIDNYLAGVVQNDSRISSGDHGQGENISVGEVDPKELLLNVKEIVFFIPDRARISEPR